MVKINIEKTYSKKKIISDSKTALAKLKDSYIW